MMRKVLAYPIVLLTLTGPASADLWSQTQPFEIGRYAISLPTGPGWSWEPGGEDQWIRVSTQQVHEGRELAFWIGFEVNAYPDNRYDWLEREIAQEVRDFYAIRLLDEAASNGEPLTALDYGELTRRGISSYWLHWTRPDSMGRTVSHEVLDQQLHVFFAPDHSVDFSYMAVFLGMRCLSNCAGDVPTAALLEPLLESVVIGTLN